MRESGHDVIYAAEESPRADDVDLLARAMREDRVLITFDTDFGDLVYLVGAPAFCGVVLFRISRVPAAERTGFIANVLIDRTDWPGHFSVIDERNIRRRVLTDT